MIEVLKCWYAFFLLKLSGIFLAYGRRLNQKNLRIILKVHKKLNEKE